MTAGAIEVVLLVALIALGAIAVVCAVRLYTVSAALFAAKATIAERAQSVVELDQVRSDFFQKNAEVARLENEVSNLNVTTLRLTEERDAARRECENERDECDVLRQARAELHATLAALQQSIAADEKRVETLKAQMGEVFEDKARVVLKERSEQFEQTSEQKKTEINDLISPLKEHLEGLRVKVDELEIKRAEVTGELKGTLEQLMQRTDALSAAATTLSTTLTGSSQARGRWGEIHLENLLERSGMSRYCDFDTQPFFKDLEGGARPDVLIRIPHVDLRVPVDAKTPDVDYRAYLEASDDVSRRGALAAHARTVENHARALGDRNYGRFPGIAPFTIMYMPVEGMLAAAMAQDPDLWDRCLRRGVYLASPLTLLIQLRAYADGWAVYEQEKNAARIAEHAAELYHRLSIFAGHFSDVGDKLARASEAYNRAAGSYQRRLLPHAEKIRELGIAVPDGDRDRVELEIEPVQIVPQQVAIAGNGKGPDADANLPLALPGTAHGSEPAET